MTPKTNEEIVKWFGNILAMSLKPSSEAMKAVRLAREELTKILNQKDKERVEAYKRGYVQGGFDAEMNRLNTPPTN